MNWNLLTSKLPKDFSELEKILLSNRGINDAKIFFEPTHPSEILLKDVGIDSAQAKNAVTRINKAIKKGDDILIFADYDADGICAGTVTWRTLKQLGANVRPFVPDRQRHGYGLTVEALEEIIKAKKPDLIITVDNGIVAHRAVEFANTHKIDVIVTDHHQVETVTPPAFAIFHTDKLCGTTVAWMLCRELAGDKLPELLDLCAVATIADQVKLLDANRSFAWHGIQKLASTANPGLKAIISSADLLKRPLDSYSVGFAIAPRINAMGRLADGMEALRLLCTDSDSTAGKIAQKLSKTNIQRQDLTQLQLETAIEQARGQKEQRLLVVASPEFHEGVIGLIAGRLTEIFAKPSIVISLSETLAKGSARSVEGVNIVEMIRTVRDDLLTVGGHPMAAGFGCEISKLETVVTKLQDLANNQIDSDLLIKKLNIDCQIPMELVTQQTIQGLEKFAPFGSGNLKPIFKISQLKIQSFQQMGKDNSHLKINAGEFEVVAFGKGQLATQLKTGQVVDVAGSLELNVWRDRSSLQIVAKDISIL